MNTTKDFLYATTMVVMVMVGGVLGMSAEDE